MNNSGDLDIVSTHYWTASVCTCGGLVVSSSSITASYQDLIGLTVKMAEDMSFAEGLGLSSFVGWVWGAFPLSLAFALGGIKICFEGILGLGNQRLNLNFL